MTEPTTTTADTWEHWPLMNGWSLRHWTAARVYFLVSPTNVVMAHLDGSAADMLLALAARNRDLEATLERRNFELMSLEERNEIEGVRDGKRIAQLEAALKAAEWTEHYRMGLVCPVCRWEKQEGHAPDCIIGNALNSGAA